MSHKIKYSIGQKIPIKILKISKWNLCSVPKNGFLCPISINKITKTIFFDIDLVLNYLPNYFQRLMKHKPSGVFVGNFFLKNKLLRKYQFYENFLKKWFNHKNKKRPV